MIDFTSFLFKDRDRLEKAVQGSRKIFPDLYSKLESRSGEEKYPLTTDLLNFQIRITEKRAKIYGSLHYLHNNLHQQGNQNHNDFTYQNLRETVDFITTNVPEIKNGHLTQLEFGVNIHTDDIPQLLLADNIRLHRLNLFNINRKYRQGGWYQQYDYNDLYLKLYDKGTQFNLDENILRCEVKLMNKRALQKLNIIDYDSLIDLHTLESLQEILLLNFDQLFIIDSYAENDNISPSVKQELDQLTNPNYWKQFNRSRRNQKSKKKKRLEFLSGKYNLNTIKKNLRNSIEEKLDYLLNN